MTTRRNLAVVGIVSLTIFGAGYAVAQETGESAKSLFEKDLATHQLQMQSYGLSQSLKGSTYLDAKDKPTDAAIADEAAGIDLYAGDYAKAADNPGLTKVVVTSTLREYSSSQADAKSAVQATQGDGEAQLKLSLLQVAQNARMIELLKQIAAQKAK